MAEMLVNREEESMIRRMQEQDIDAVTAIEQEIFSKPWSKKSFLDAIQSAHTIYLAAEEKTGIMGYCGIWLSGESADLCNMAVVPSCRRRGIGKGLLSEAIRLSIERGAEEIFLEVRESNHPAIVLYEKTGFERIGIRKGYYHAPTEDAIIMRCFLADSKGRHGW